MHEIVNSQWNYIQKITMEILTLKYGKQTEREEKWKNDTSHGQWRTVIIWWNMKHYQVVADKMTTTTTKYHTNCKQTLKSNNCENMLTQYYTAIDTQIWIVYPVGDRLTMETIISSIESYNCFTIQTFCCCIFYAFFDSGFSFIIRTLWT